MVNRMRANKIFCVIAYDSADTKRRNKMIKLIEKYGRRINYSVYECMFTDAQLKRLKERLSEIVVKGKDSVAIYPICVNCYTRVVYIPQHRSMVHQIVIFE